MPKFCAKHQGQPNRCKCAGQSFFRTQLLTGLCKSSGLSMHLNAALCMADDGGGENSTERMQLHSSNH